MTDIEIIDYLKLGGVLNYGCHGRNMEVIALIDRLESEGLVVTEDCSTSQETRREVRWIAGGAE
jgi:hypothetical protein